MSSVVRISRLFRQNMSRFSYLESAQNKLKRHTFPNEWDADWTFDEGQIILYKSYISRTEQRSKDVWDYAAL